MPTGSGRGVPLPASGNKHFCPQPASHRASTIPGVVGRVPRRADRMGGPPATPTASGGLGGLRAAAASRGRVRGTCAAARTPSRVILLPPIDRSGSPSDSPPAAGCPPCDGPQGTLAACPRSRAHGPRRRRATARRRPCRGRCPPRVGARGRGAARRRRRAAGVVGQRQAGAGCQRRAPDRTSGDRSGAGVPSVLLGFPW